MHRLTVKQSGNIKTQFFSYSYKICHWAGLKTRSLSLLVSCTDTQMHLQILQYKLKTLQTFYYVNCSAVEIKYFILNK